MMRPLRNGMTLVELLIALVILAGMTTLVATSLSGAKERELTAKSIRQGEGLISALETVDGLSYLSDLGHLPGSLGELTALTRQQISATVQLDLGGGVISTTDELKTLPAFTTLTAPLIPTNAVSQLGWNDTASAFQATNGLAQVTLEAGWRGPYLREKVVIEDEVLTDPWGNPWEMTHSAGTITLTGRGRDQEADSETATHIDWQDRDRTFTTRPLKSNTVLLTVKVPDEETNPLTLHAFLYEPQLTIPTTVGAQPALAVGTRYFTASGSNTLTLTECLPGVRQLFVYAKSTGGTIYTASLVTFLIREGNTAVTVRLR